ncbi:hypothetical protein GCM10007086_12040 [Photobacterium aphoticum]|nr:hypothetical protein GCM10007086_12040 [Photobacterium aphoticum]
MAPCFVLLDAIYIIPTISRQLANSPTRQLANSPTRQLANSPTAVINPQSVNGIFRVKHVEYAPFEIVVGK